MIVMWKTERGEAKIERVECTRVSYVSVWFMRRPFVIGAPDLAVVETKATRRGDRVTYHETWEEAHAHLLKHAALAVQPKRRQLELANAHLGNIKGLRKPAAIELEATDRVGQASAQA